MNRWTNKGKLIPPPPDSSSRGHNKTSDRRVVTKSVTLTGFEDKDFVSGVSNGEGNVDPYGAHSIILFASFFFFGFH